ncbi:MAG: segregation/condensation protein A [Opitutales bacterium]
MILRPEHPIKLAAFEGPLDLLLFLIRRQEIDVYDIPIQKITKQYLAVLSAIEEVRLDIAGEFFVMAATLMEIKSRTLLPKHQQPQTDDEEEELDPRWELVHQLLEYQKFKSAARDLGKLAEERAESIPRFVPEGPGYTGAERPLKPSSPLDIWHAFNHVLKRLSEKLTLGEITGENVTVSDQMESILERSSLEKKFLFSTIFAGRKQVSIKLVIATFLALLELVRLKKLAVRQIEAFSDIQCFVQRENELEKEKTSATL